MWLGLSVGVVEANYTLQQKYAGFGADITFITAPELCFAFLRDRTVGYASDIVCPPPSWPMHRYTLSN